MTVLKKQKKNLANLGPRMMTRQAFMLLKGGKPGSSIPCVDSNYTVKHRDGQQGSGPPLMHTIRLGCARPVLPAYAVECSC